MSAWVKALEKYIATKGEEVIPPGWQTRNEIAKLFGRTPSTTSRILAEMMKEGKAETKKFKGVVWAGEKNQKKLMKGGPRQKYLRKTPYFRLISPPIKPPVSKSYKQSSNKDGQGGRGGIECGYANNHSGKDGNSEAKIQDQRQGENPLVKAEP